MQVYFTVVHEAPPLEDTLPELAPDQLLPERLNASAGRKDLLKGLGVAVGALVASSVAANSDLGRDGRVLAIAVGGMAGIAGVSALLNARHERDLPANVAGKSPGRTPPLAANATIARRNAEKEAQTVVVSRAA